MSLTPRQFVLQIMSVLPAQGSISAEALVRAADVLELPEGAVRVALTRLKRDGLVDTIARATYRLTPAARPVQETVERWREREAEVRPWEGAWLAVHVAALPGRARSPAVRTRHRALELLGFRKPLEGLWLRPDNLVANIDDLRARLVALGLDADAPVFRITDLDAATREKTLAAYEIESLRASYEALTSRMGALKDDLEADPKRSLARQVYILGNEVLRTILFDPMLPYPLIDTDQRRRMITTMIEFDHIGRGLWESLMDISGSGVGGHYV